MRISDWSSDVCSSDLAVGAGKAQPAVGVGGLGLKAGGELVDHGADEGLTLLRRHVLGRLDVTGGRPARPRLFRPRNRRRLDAELAGGTGNLLLQRPEEHTSELQALMRISYAVFCLKK